jgi:hypothetical protein
MGVSNLIQDSISQAQNEGDELALMIHKVSLVSHQVIVKIKDA